MEIDPIWQGETDDGHPPQKNVVTNYRFQFIIFLMCSTSMTILNICLAIDEMKDIVH